jgi:hypothetical protein
LILKWSWSLHLFLGRPMFRHPFGLYCCGCFGSVFVSILCTCSIFLLGQNANMLIHTLSCLETFCRKVLICNIRWNTISNLPLSDLDTLYGKPMIHIFRYVMLVQYLLIMTNDAYVTQSTLSAIQNS